MTSINSISHPVEIGLRFTGIWPGYPYRMLFQSVWVIVMSIAQVFQYQYIITHLSFDDLDKLIDSVSTTLPYSLLCFKLVIFWSNCGILKIVLIKMSNDWSLSDNVKLNTNAMVNKADLSDRCSKAIIGVYAAAVFLYSGAFLQLIRNDGVNNPNIKSRELLIKMELPLELYETPAYECVLFLQFLQLLAIASAIGMLDALIMTMILHIGGQIDMLQQALSKIAYEDRKYGMSGNFLKSLISRHYRIIVLSKSVERLFSSIALMQFLCNTLVICCIGFIIVISLNADQNVQIVAKVLLFYVAITMEAFIFSFAGEYLSNKSKSISDAAYGSLWYLLKPEDSRVLLLLILRSQKRLTITAGKFMDLSLEGFAGMLKASVSYVSVLYAMY